MAQLGLQHVDTVIIGAGHAGLAMRRCLSDRNIEHVVLEKVDVANSWKSERWDSLRLLTPNWQSRLPGFAYDGDDPDGDGACNAGDSTPNGELTLSFGAAGQMSIDINYSSTNPIGGYQFQVHGVTLTAAYDTFDLINFYASNGMVIGFDMSGANLPAGDGTLIHLEFEAIDGGGEISLSELVFGDESGNEMNVASPNSANVPACDNYDDDIGSFGVIIQYVIIFKDIL